MKYVKMLGLLAVAAAALMAFAGTAGATTVTAPSGTTYTSTIKASAEPGTLELHGSLVTVTCNKSEVEGKIEKHGEKDAKGKTLPASGKITKLTFAECNHHVESPVGQPGTLQIIGTGNGEGTLTSVGAKVKIVATTIFGAVTCVYTTEEATHLGPVTKAPSNTGHAKLDISATIKIDPVASSGLCGETAEWTGSYKVTSPTGLSVD